MHPESQWTIITVCRRSDRDRASRFFKAIQYFGASGAMGDLDDGPEQTPLDANKVQGTILEMLGGKRFDLIITHGIRGEYTRHLRHEETSKAVMALYESKKVLPKEIWKFAYQDNNGKCLPYPMPDADLKTELPEEIWQKKYDIITDIYGFEADSFEAKTTPREETFRRIKKDRIVK